MFTIKNLKSIIYQYKQNLSGYKRVIIIAIIALALSVPASYLVALKINHQKDKSQEEQVLGRSIANSSPTPTPTPAPTLSPTPTPRVLRPTPKPTTSPAALISSSPSPTTSSSSDSASSNSQESPTPSPSPSPTPSPSPSPQGLTVEVKIDYAGFVPNSSEVYTVNVEPGQTAWDAVKKAVGVDHINYSEDPTWGAFISGFNGVIPDYNSDHKFWLFKINGESASVGVSSYVCNDGDILEFMIADG